MGHTFSKLLYHCVFSTRERRPLITDDISERLLSYIAGILRNHNGHLIKGGGTADHVHLLMELDASTPVADAMRLVKANTTKWIHETFPEHAAFAWQTGYAAFTVSLSAVPQVTSYIENQKEHHRLTSFDDELLAFARRHGLEEKQRA